jgi:hypothetical protein
MLGGKTAQAMNTNQKITKVDIRRFRDLCTYARSIFVHFRHLFETGPENRAILNRCAPKLFGDICYVLRSQIILEACKITDPAVMRSHENLTIEYVMTHLQDRKIIDRLKDRADRLHAFRKKIEPARNKIISHNDRDTILSGNALGGASIEDWNQFWQDLSRFLEILSDRYLGESGFHLAAPSNQTDVPELFSALQPGWIGTLPG